MRLSLFIAGIIFVSASFTNMTWAQSPSAPVPMPEPDLHVDFNQAFSEIQNPFLNDAIKLHYQITLLDKMSQRQAELLKIKETFDALSIPYNEPAPALNLCKQLPANGPCIKHYPNLYASLITERKKFHSEQAAKQMLALGRDLPADMASDLAIDPEIAERARKERAERAKRAEEERIRQAAEERRNRYQWSNVSCLSGNCQGVIVGPNNYRASVHVGSRLADGTLVDAVSRGGVSLIIDGERVALRPAPADAGAASASGLSAALNNNAVTVQTPQNPSISIVDVEVDAPATSVSADNNVGEADLLEPALGPSGLF